MSKKVLRSLSGSRFFGLTSEYRVHLFSMIHDIVYHGKGGFDWHTVYNMPIWLRKFTYKRIVDFVENKNEQQKSQASTNSKAGKTRSINFAKPPSDIQPGKRI